MAMQVHTNRPVLCLMPRIHKALLAVSIPQPVHCVVSPTWLIQMKDMRSTARSTMFPIATTSRQDGNCYVGLGA